MDISEKLHQLGDSGRLTPAFLAFYERLYGVQYEVENRIELPALSGTANAMARLRRGLPLLRFDRLTINWPLLQYACAEVVATLAAYPELFGELPDSLREPVHQTPALKELVRSWFEEGNVPSQVDGREVNQPVLEIIIHAALRPFLVKHASAWKGLVEQESWRRNYCPVCGGSPDFATLDKETGARWLMCSRCDMEWLFQRLECPYCGTVDQDALAYYTDEEGAYRLYVCEKCGCYLKAIDLRHAGPEVSLPLERLSTLTMDSQAQEYGYTAYGSAVIKPLH